LLLAEDESTSVVSGALVGVLLSQSTSPSVVLSAFLLIDINHGFLTEGKLPAIFIKPSLGVPNWPGIYFINSVASGLQIQKRPDQPEEAPPLEDGDVKQGTGGPINK
jgi:hypothetical protein